MIDMSRKSRERINAGTQRNSQGNGPGRNEITDRDAMWRTLVAASEDQRSELRNYLSRVGTGKAKNLLAALEQEWSLRAGDIPRQDVGTDAVAGDHRQVGIEQAVGVVKLARPERAEDIDRRVS